MDSDAFTTYDFNLASLLRLNDLDLHNFAEGHKKLTVREYFGMLSQFLSIAPDVSDAIKRFADDEPNPMDWKHIKNIIALFREMECNKYINDLHAIRDACERGDHRSAASHAVNIDQNFKNLYSQVMSAKITKEADDFPDVGSPLLSCIKILDEKKADQKLLVLAVDDSTAILESVSAVLSSDYTVYKLPKPMLLEKVLEQFNPDLFLLDYQMPERNGFELIPIIRGIEKHKDTPIIFLTSEGTVNHIKAAVGLGACDFIVKPFNPEQLREKIAKHIGQ
jgi:CheY-like chemotaxis protein